jgi:uncharacterized protein
MEKSIQNKIIGREAEIASLKKAYGSKKAEFVAVYGRRRVGKTFLIRHFFKQQDCVFFQLTGIHKANLKIQLAEFTKELETLYIELGIRLNLKSPTSWLNAFEMLSEATKHTKKKVILFLDEFPWMAGKKSKLLEAVDYYWNRHWVDNEKIKLVICGSAASWIIENILNNKAGLHNRVTLRLLIEPFNLRETQEYLKKEGVPLEHSQILELYMCIGGIPFYLNYIKSGLSVTQNINELCFKKQGSLVEEFNNLFSSLFQKSDMHETIVKLLASHRHGISRKKIEQLTNYKGGGLTRVLKELVHAGFIEGFIPSMRDRGVHYRLIDEYSLFYLNWISPPDKQQRIKEVSTKFWEGAVQSAAWKAWAGYAFEAICFKHIEKIKNSLKIPQDSLASTWQHIAKKSSSTSGTQIDLLFDRNDGIITLCEIKYSNKKYKLDKEYAALLQNKIEIYKKVTKTNKQVVLSMFTTHGLQPSTYLEGLVWSSATVDNLFQ